LSSARHLDRSTMPPDGPSSSDKPTKKISCKRCQYRKFKCSRTEPCQNCTTANTPCEYRPVDRKRVPVSHEYVASLESRLTWFESLVRKLRAATAEEREEVLNSAALDQNPSSNAKAPKADVNQAPGEYVTQLGIHARSQANLELGLEGSLVYQGATSIFRADTPDLPPKDPNLAMEGYFSGIESNFESVMQHFDLSMSSSDIMPPLTQFFRWQYPHFIFIYREAFLRDHFGDRKNGKYWSPALLLSICALGALVGMETKARSERFFLAAESIIMVTGLTRPSVATVQAFLCLALYEIGRGNSSKGWGYSGIAFRMAQDLGFQRDPKDWVHHDSSLATPEDVEIRRRIYWGCYISDKLISLILGRPVYLVYEDAKVQPMETLPEPPEMVLWRPVGFDEEFAESTRAASMIPYLHEQIRLSRVIETMMSILFSPRSNLDSLSRRVCFDNLNLELNRWRESLPDFAKWHKWGSSSKPIPGVLALHLLFHSVRIALNYDQAVASRGGDTEEKLRLYCITSAQDITSLLRTYRSQYGLQHAPLVFVYGAVQASRSVKAFGITEESQYLIQMLRELSSAWSLSREVLVRVWDC
ncbi:transcription factor, partial [Colletotrichum incanum]